MTLHLIPRISAHAHEQTLIAMDGCPPRVDRRVRTAARDHLFRAAQAKLIGAREVTRAAKQGDIGIAHLMASKRLPMHRPVVGPDILQFACSIDCPPLAMRDAATWVRYLSSWGYLTAAEVEAVEPAALDIGTVANLALRGWSRLKQETLDQNPLSGRLDGELCYCVDAEPGFIDLIREHICSYTSERELPDRPGQPLLHIQTELSAFQLRGTPQSAALIAAALRELQDRIHTLTMIPVEHTLEHVDPMQGEIVLDLRNLATFTADGEVILDEAEASDMIAGATGDDAVHVSHALDMWKDYLEWQHAFQSARSAFASDVSMLDSRQLREGMPDSVLSVVDGIRLATGTLPPMTVSRARGGNFATAEASIVFIPANCGIEDALWDSVDYWGNEAELNTSAINALQGNSTQVLSDVKRVLNEIVATNFVSNLISRL